MRQGSCINVYTKTLSNSLGLENVNCFIIIFNNMLLKEITVNEITNE